MRKAVSIVGGMALVIGLSAMPAQATSSACLADYMSALGACPKPGSPGGGSCAGEAQLMYQFCMEGLTDSPPPDCDATPNAEGCSINFG